MVGEHIRALKGGRWIHAIDCGDETVLHLAEDQTPRRVRRAYRPEFVSGAETVERVTHRERTFPPKEVVRRAYSRAADATLASMFRDSEAFAAWCTTGRPSGPRNVAIGVPAEAQARATAPKRKPAKPPPKRKRVAAKSKHRAKGRARPRRSAAARTKVARRAAKPARRTSGRGRRR
jgi:hypothetical protein